MGKGRKLYGNIFTAIAFLGALFCLAEIIFQSFGKSICPTEGCSLVSGHSRFGDISILLIGLAAFSLLALLSYIALHRNGASSGKYIDLILVVSLSAEGFFVGYQVFRLNTLCLSCAIIFCFFLALGILRLLYGSKEVIAGFISFAAVFSLFYLVLPASGPLRLPAGELVLFYSEDCRYCSEVMKRIEADKIQVSHMKVREYSGLLKNIGIEHVPTLLVNKKNQKLFLTGRDAIYQYLFVDTSGQMQKDATMDASVRTEKKPPARQGKSPQGRDLPKLPKDSPLQFFIQPADEGVCLEGKVEKKECD